MVLVVNFLILYLAKFIFVFILLGTSESWYSNLRDLSTSNIGPNYECYLSFPSSPPGVDSIAELLLRKPDSKYSKTKWLAYYAWKIRDRQTLGPVKKSSCVANGGSQSARLDKPIIECIQVCIDNECSDELRYYA